jgi:hypothetical protein
LRWVRNLSRNVEMDRRQCYRTIIGFSYLL